MTQRRVARTPRPRSRVDGDVPDDEVGVVSSNSRGRHCVVAPSQSPRGAHFGEEEQPAALGKALERSPVSSQKTREAFVSGNLARVFNC